MVTPFATRAIAAFLTTASLFAADAAQAACNRRVDSQKAVLFVDTNFGFSEMKAAEEAACARGESFVRVPAPVAGEEAAYKNLLRLDGVEYEMEKLYTAQETQKCETPEANVERCTTIANRMAALEKMYHEVSATIEAHVAVVRAANGNNDFIYGATEKALNKMAAEGVKVTSVIGSGHSGGSSFGGRYGGIGFSAMQKLIKNAYKSSPELLASFGSIFLWGCNTNNPHMPEQWMTQFPSLYMVAGFQGSAPSNVNPASRQILADLIRSEDELSAIATSARSDADIKRAFDRISGIAGSVAAIYLRDTRAGRGWFYERLIEDTISGGQRWVTRVLPLVSAQQCEPLRAEISRDQAYVDGIFAGDTAISTETGSGTLRTIYTRSRRNDACRAKLGFGHSANQIGLALFWHGVKKNAMRLLAPQAESVTNSVNAILASPSVVENAVAAANAESQNTVNARVQKLNAERTEVQSKLDQAKSELSRVSAAESLLPWSKKRNRELKRYLRREKKFTRKLNRGRDVQNTLTTIKNEIARYRMAKQIADNGRMETTKIESEISTQQSRLSTIDSQIQSASQSVAKVTSSAVMTELSQIARTLAPKSVSEVAPLSYAEILSMHRDRTAAIARLEKAVSASRHMMSAMAPTLSALKSWNKNFQTTVIDLNDNCMDFMAWHEYVASAGASAQPRIACQ